MNKKYHLKRIFSKWERCIPKSIWKILQNKWIYHPRIIELRIDSGTTPLFDAVFFEVRTRCNGTCPFCAASIQNETRQDTTMPMKLYIKVINELKDIGFSGRIAYHVNNDPLIFHKLSDFVKYARTNLPSVWIQILTNGKGLTEKKAESLIDAGINELSINYYNDDQTVEVSKKIQNISENVLPRYYKEHQIKTGHGPDTDNKNIFRFNLFRPMLNTIKTSRAGTAPNKKFKSGQPRGFCEYPFTQFNITTDGRVSKCCADLYFSDPMGNVKENSLMEIWNGQQFEKVRNLLLEGNRDVIETCSKCDFFGVKRFYSIIGNFIHISTQ